MVEVFDTTCANNLEVVEYVNFDDYVASSSIASTICSELLKYDEVDLTPPAFACLGAISSATNCVMDEPGICPRLTDDGDICSCAVYDCSGERCVDQYLLRKGDGECDDGIHTSFDLNCATFDFDGGDCQLCTEYDCTGEVCLDQFDIYTEIWGDNFCDDGINSRFDLNCTEFEFDYGDCKQCIRILDFTGSEGFCDHTCGGGYCTVEELSKLEPILDCDGVAVTEYTSFYGDFNIGINSDLYGGEEIYVTPQKVVDFNIFGSGYGVCTSSKSSKYNFACPKFKFENGFCCPDGQATRVAGKQCCVVSCTNTCLDDKINTVEIANGVCDEDLNCALHDYDGGDCEGMTAVPTASPTASPTNSPTTVAEIGTLCRDNNNYRDKN